MASCTNPIILYVIYSFVGQCIFLCKVKLLLYISLNPFVKRYVSYFHCSIIVSLYYTVAYYSKELVKNKDVAKPQVSEGNETEGSVRHLIPKSKKKKKKRKNNYIYIYAYIYILDPERNNLPPFCICKIFLLFWKIPFSDCCFTGLWCEI